jgi:DNA polymerase-1
MPTLVLVDGSSYLYRAFHALPDLRTRQGEPTGALRGVLSMLRRLVIDGKPDYFAVVFDAPGKTFRDDWYPEYKANRAAMPDDLTRQIEPLHALVRAHGWPLIMVEGVEADDVIGTLAAQARAAGIETIISTSDKDLAQLVCPHVKLINTMSNDTYDEAGVIAKFDVRADQVLDLLTLTGDAVDNIPGVAKVGPKTAAKWLQQYGTLDNLIASAHEIGGVVGNNLREALEWLPQAKKLLTVRTDCDLPMNVQDLVLGPADDAAVRAMYERFEFKQWLKDMGDKGDAGDVDREPAESTAATPALRRWAAASDSAIVAPPAPSQVVRETVQDEATLVQWLECIDMAEVTSFHIEGSSFDPMQARVVGVALCVAPGHGAYIPLDHRYAGAPQQLDRARTLARLAPWLADPSKKKLGHNVKFDEHALANEGLVLRGVAHDPLLESYVLESHKPHDMDNLAWRHLNVRTIAYDDVTGKGVNRIPFDQVAVERATEYAAEDADITLRLHEALHPAIAADDKLAFIYGRVELPVRDVLFRMERNGILVDAELLAKHGRSLGERVLALEREAHALAGGPFNLGSPKQICEVLFTRMKLPVLKKTATGSPSTDEDVLQQLAADYPLPKLLLEHRALAKLKSTYTDKLPVMINASTGRVHTTFAQATAVTGRLASNDPNLQNIPVRTAEGRRIREAFIAPPGHVILSADYSQIELRIMAHLSEDAALVHAFQQGHDIHRATAAEIFGVPPDQVTSDQRRYIKAVNFGLIYGMSAFGLAQQLDIERSAAAQFIDKYFTRYPGVARYMQRTRESARANGYVETVFGRRLWLPDINAGGGPRRAAAERAAINAPMQGTAADLIKLAMIEVQRWLDAQKLATKLVLQVHDELVFEVPEGEVERVKRELPGLMSGVSTLSVPLVVDVGIGRNWDEAH